MENARSARVYCSAKSIQYKQTRAAKITEDERATVFEEFSQVKSRLGKIPSPVSG